MSRIVYFFQQSKKYISQASNDVFLLRSESKFYLLIKFDRHTTELTNLCSFAEDPLMTLITSVCNLIAILGINGP